MIRTATESDAAAITRIYNHYILHTVVTFEEDVIGVGEMAARINAVASASLPWLVAERHDEVVGYAYAHLWKSRSAYRFTVESTIYLEPASLGQGLGTTLYMELIASLHDNSVHVVVAGVALPNPASVALHERLGFEKVAHFKEVGFKFNRWVDVGYWQRLL